MNAAASISPTNPVTLTPLDEAMLCARVFEAEPGERIEYHRGFLGVDRSPLGQHADRQTRSTISRTADRAFALAENGAVHLVQKRLAPDCFSYLAVVRPRLRQVERRLADLPAVEPS